MVPSLRHGSFQQPETLCLACKCSVVHSKQKEGVKSYDVAACCNVRLTDLFLYLVPS